MPRDADALKIQKWAGPTPGNREDLPAALVASGWGPSYSQVGGIVGPERVYFNQVLCQITAMGVEYNTRGCPPPWSGEIDYKHTAFAIGSDGRMYVSLQDSGPANGTATDPTDADNEYWRLY